jgi:hypothetical protein
VHTNSVDIYNYSATTGAELAFGLIEPSAPENLAFAEAAAGKLTDAIALADLAVWHAALANLPAAHNHVRRMLTDEKGLPDTTEWPEYCYWAAAQVFRLEGNMPQASRALDRGGGRAARNLARPPAKLRLGYAEHCASRFLFGIVSGINGDACAVP